MLARIRPPAHLQRGDGDGQPLSQGGQTFPQGGQNLSQGGDCPEEWRKAPALTQGPSKKYPHLSKAVEVGQSLSFFLVKQPFIFLSPISSPYNFLRHSPPAHPASPLLSFFFPTPSAPLPDLLPSSFCFSDIFSSFTFFPPHSAPLHDLLLSPSFSACHHASLPLSSVHLLLLLHLIFSLPPSAYLPSSPPLPPAPLSSFNPPVLLFLPSFSFRPLTGQGLNRFVWQFQRE